MKPAFLIRTVVAIGLFIPAIAQAAVNVDVGSMIQLSNGLGDTGGGRFGVTGVNSANQALAAFDTFCVETTVNQFVSFDNSGVSPVYKVKAIGTQTTGREGDLGSIRTLTSKIAWAYNAFRTGDNSDMGLKGFDYSSAASADNLQFFVWHNLNASYGVNLDDFYPDSWDANYQAAVDSGAWAGIGSVRIMQLVEQEFDSNGALVREINRQDQLVMIPEATSLTTWSLLAVVGLGWTRRRS